MDLVEVVSSTIKAVGYQDEDMVVLFNSGIKYKYTRVPIEKYKALLESDSKGKYFNQNIKNSYQYERLL